MDDDNEDLSPFDDSFPEIVRDGMKHCEEDALKHRGEIALKRNLHLLPKLTKAHRAIVIRMMIVAYRAGQSEAALWAKMERHWDMKHRSQLAVRARRSKSKRLAIIRDFKAAARKKQDVSIEQLARQHGVSRATAYRAINSMDARKPPAKTQK